MNFMGFVLDLGFFRGGKLGRVGRAAIVCRRNAVRRPQSKKSLPSSF
jgi:hypothetical protein